MGFGLSWIYWIPCADGSWLFFSTEEDTFRIVGEHVAQVMDDQQIMAQLAAGTLNIGIAHVDDVKQMVKISREVAQCLSEFFLE
jgi:hypothetical protein